MRKIYFILTLLVGFGSLAIAQSPANGPSDYNQLMKDLATAAARTGYTAEKTGATAAYIALIKQIAAEGETAVAEKAAKDLLKNATKARVVQTRIAALDILFFVENLRASSKKSTLSKKVSDALKDPDREYRKGALNIASGYADKEMYVEVIKVMAKAAPEVKVDILNWLGCEAEQLSRQELIRNLDIRFDLPARQVLVAQLDDKRKGEKPDEEMFRVKEAAVWALVKIGDPSFIPVLARLLADGEERIVLIAQKGLSVFPGDIDAAVAKAILRAANAGKIAGVELLAQRRATANVNTVLEQLKSDSPEVKAAAYAALKDVVGERDLVNLCGMLETADALAIPPLQRAVQSSLSGMETEKQVAFVTRRMLQAGDQKKHLYYRVLASTGDSEALKNIVNDFYAGPEVRQKAAFDALLHWPTPEVADILFAICQDTSLSSFFEPAFSRYVEWISDPSFTAEERLLNLRKAMDMARTDEQKISFRNLYIKELERKEPFRLSAEEQEEGFQVLFDGTNMHEWQGNTVDYVLEDGCISMVPSKSFGGNLYTRKEYDNFIYRFEFQLTPAANNGVGIRTPLEGDAAYAGMEIQILDCEHPVYKDITPLQHHGSVYGIIPAQAHALKPVGEWNTEEIRAEGDHIRVTVNGVVVLEGNIREAVKNGTPDGKEHPGLFNKKGHIGFLGHGSPVKFRNIRIKELK